MALILTILTIIMLIWLFVSVTFFESGYKSRYGNNSLDEPRTKTNWNAIALFLNIRDGELKLPKRKTGIDKEIAEEEKEIAELELQKEKMDRLAELKRRKERLFEEVQESEVTEKYTHCKWCCGENTLKTTLTRDGISYHTCTICDDER